MQSQEVRANSLCPRGSESGVYIREIDTRRGERNPSGTDARSSHECYAVQLGSVVIERGASIYD